MRVGVRVIVDKLSIVEKKEILTALFSLPLFLVCAGVLYLSKIKQATDVRAGVAVRT